MTEPRSRGSAVNLCVRRGKPAGAQPLCGEVLRQAALRSCSRPCFGVISGAMKNKARHILLGVTGSIAAYKAVELVRLMRKRDWEVSVIMTRAATKFVGELTFRTLSRNPVAVDMFDAPEEWCPEHLALAERADAVVVAPCTANVIAKIAHGLADDLLACAVLAAAAPVIVAPAMNARMWDNPAMRANVKLLLSRGVHVVDVESGELACGCEGRGRMASLDSIMSALDRVLRKAR